MEKELVVTTNLEDVNSVSKRLTVDVPADKVTKSIKAALASLKKDAKIPGFRPGKVPDEMIKKRLGASYNEEVMRQVVRDTYPEAVQLSGARPISDPRIEADKFEVVEGKPLTYKVVFEVYPTVEPEGYGGLKLEKEKVKVTDDEIEHELKALQTQMTQLEPAPDATLEKGVLARVDFNGTADGKSFQGSEAKDFIVDVEAGNILPEFEKQICGMKQGEERDIEFTYPKDYFNKKIAGKKGSFHIAVKELRRKVVPVLDDSFAKDLGQFKTLDEVKKVLRERIEQAKEGQQQAKLQRQVMEALSKNQPIDVPDALVSRELGHMLEDLSHQLEARGQTLEDAGVEANAFVKEHLAEAQLRVRSYIIARAVAEKEKLAVADDEVNGRLMMIAAQTQKKEQEIRAHFEKNNLMPGLKDQMLVEKALNFIIDKAKVKETSPKKEKK